MNYADYYNGRSGGMQQRSPFSMLSPMARYIDARIKRRGSMLATANPYSPEGMDTAAMGQRLGYGNPMAYAGGGAPAAGGMAGRAYSPTDGQRFPISMPGFPILGTPQNPGYPVGRPPMSPDRKPTNGYGMEFGDVMPRRRPIRIPLY